MTSHTEQRHGRYMVPTEVSALLFPSSGLRADRANARSLVIIPPARRIFAAVVFFFFFVIYAVGFALRSHTSRQNETSAIDSWSAFNNDTEDNGPFPSDFVWGVATSAYQVEGAVTEDGRGETVWDTFVRQPGAIADNSTGAMADDHYHRWKEDVVLIKSLNVTSYRFSIAWSRIVPDGQGTVNEAGIRFYDGLIDELKANDIEPWITLFHWDLPQTLQDEFGGWLDKRTVDAFVLYARVVFKHFSSKVKRFITLNEPWT